MQFPIIIEKDKDGYYATCPSLSGCSTQGESYEEAVDNIKDAIKLYVQDCIEDNELVLASETVSFQVLDIPIKESRKKK